MSKAGAWVIAGAVLVTAGVAHAQESTPVERDQARAAAPWYQRFTHSNGLTETNPSLAGDDVLPPAWTMNQRWGVTVDVREGEAPDFAAPALRSDQTAVGAYYQFTPRVRVGGQVSVGTAQSGLAAEADRGQDEPAAGVRIESAFRF